MAKIITTREIYVHLAKGPRKLGQTTTKHVDASIKVVQPKNPQPPVILSTTGLPDVQDIIDKKKRDDIMAQRKLYETDKKKIAPVEKEKTVEEIPAVGAVELKISNEDEVKKPWKDMTAEERDVEVEKQIIEPMEEKKLEMAERMAKARAAKGKKKKEK